MPPITLQHTTATTPNASSDIVVRQYQLPVIDNYKRLFHIVYLFRSHTNYFGLFHCFHPAMEPAAHLRTTRTRGPGINDPAGGGRRPHSRNKQWVAIESDAPSGRRTPSHVDGERWERGGHRGGRGTRGIVRGGLHQFPNASLRIAHSLPNSSAATTDDEDNRGGEGGEDEENYELEDQDPDTPEEREKFYQEVSVEACCGA